jgi:predicted amino acid racemase
MRIEVDCTRILANTRAIVDACTPHGIQVVGVTKACCGDAEVARAMLAGGAAMLAESRLTNVRRLRAAGVGASIEMLRLPRLAEVHDVVRLTQVSLNSEVDSIRALSRAADSQGVTHEVILIIETGDRREGIMPDDAAATALMIDNLPGIDVAGVAANVGCIGGVIPTPENTRLLIEVAEHIEHALGRQLRIISGGHTASIGLIKRHEMPGRVNQLRVGEGILLGVDSSSNAPLPTPYHDAFTVVADVIEVRTKPSLPEGIVTVDAFGRTPTWKDHGLRRRAILAMGEQDLRVSGLHPRRRGITLVGASSDHTVVDVTDADPPVLLGEELEFDPNYAAMATAMASQDVEKIVHPIS